MRRGPRRARGARAPRDRTAAEPGRVRGRAVCGPRPTAIAPARARMTSARGRYRAARPATCAGVGGGAARGPAPHRCRARVDAGAARGWEPTIQRSDRGVIALRARSTRPGRAHGTRAVERRGILVGEPPQRPTTPATLPRPAARDGARPWMPGGGTRPPVRRRPGVVSPARSPLAGGDPQGHVPVSSRVAGSAIARRVWRRRSPPPRPRMRRPRAAPPGRRLCASGGWPTLPALPLSVVRVRMISPAVTGPVLYRIS